ncbi:putative membrane protein [Cucumis melo var. makuwa]|uniref:Membrane protein n=2 Tax=Cucumis melo TaxID=3656 RepID=A0A5D3DB30_CUCMM|nr:putative membrane protein [Cucumis melo var. makuwa]TYK20811.1 putative membrane protein [Cucumis melo var. makuwa]
MSDLSSIEAPTEKHYHHYSACNPIPSPALYILIPLFILGFSVSIFVLVVVHNAFFFISLLFLSIFLSTFALWNSLNFSSKTAILSFLHSLPDSDLTIAREGQFVKISGFASCGTVSLESSYEKAAGCVYASTSLYEYRGMPLIFQKITQPYCGWRLVYSERFSTDFYITDRKTGIRAMVRAGPGSKLVPLIIESKLVNTTRHRKILSPSLRKWLREKNISTEARMLRLEEGYVQEGSFVSVLGMLHRNNGQITIVQPPDVISTGCVWRKLLLPIYIDGVVLGVSQTTGPSLGPGSLCHQEQFADI